MRKVGSNPVRVASLVEAAVYAMNMTISHNIATYIRLCACMFRNIPKIRDRVYRCRLVLELLHAVIQNEWRWIVGAHGHGKCYIVHSDEPLSAFLELEAIAL